MAPALERKRRMLPPVKPIVDGATEAHIIALCCSEPRQGRAYWSIRLLTSELKKRYYCHRNWPRNSAKNTKKTFFAFGKSKDSASQSEICRDS
jgi:hypothetical protein